jgi:hypothetical protein
MAAFPRRAQPLGRTPHAGFATGRWPGLRGTAVAARSVFMRTAISLIGLGIVGGLLPAGPWGVEHLAPVLGGAACALGLLVAACLVAPGLAARAHRTRRPRTDGPRAHDAAARVV